MNALCNSQYGELEKFLRIGFGAGKEPVRFDRYTGQENREQRDRIIQTSTSTASIATTRPTSLTPPRSSGEKGQNSPMASTEPSGSSWRSSTEIAAGDPRWRPLPNPPRPARRCSPPNGLPRLAVRPTHARTTGHSTIHPPRRLRMNAIDRQFTKIINGTMQFVIPVFQHNYSWTEAQCGGSSGRICSRSQGTRPAAVTSSARWFMSPRAIRRAGFTRWLLIDGQQRVTTLTLLLTALRHHILDTGWAGGEDAPTPKKLEAYFLKNVQEEGSRQYKLVLRRHDQDTLRALLDRDVAPEDGLGADSRELRVLQGTAS